MANVSRQNMPLATMEGMDAPVPASSVPMRREAALAEPAPAEPFRVSATGWISFLREEPPAAIAWIELQPGGEIRGAEVDLEAITSRMVAVLPAEKYGGDLYQLFDHAGQPFPPSASPKSTDHALALEIGSLLPGWHLIALPPNGPSAGGRAFFLLSSLLLGVLLTSIVSGGSLLLYQAHRHAVDARQKSSFVSNVSHELKTPLTTIRMYAELIGEGRVRDESRKRRYLDVIIAESQRLTRLINNVLDFSRLEQAKKPASIQTIALQESLIPILDAQEIRLQQAGLTLHRDLPSEPLLVTADADALEQAVLNLLDNAIKYAATGGEIIVQAETGGARASLHFLDRGPGIEPKERDHLFTKFHRGDTSLTARQPGCGLGLNIARRLLRRAGGDLTYSPRQEGGSRFTIELPKHLTRNTEH
jgi:two-component system, OmpR family, phosphate regulon sensor histidine kinase PhoR